MPKRPLSFVPLWEGTDQNRQFIEPLPRGVSRSPLFGGGSGLSGGKVVARYRFERTHLGAFQGMPPTDKQAVYAGILIYRIAGGKIAEQWTEFDLLGFLRQFGVLPSA